jgi:trigger factor
MGRAGLPACTNGQVIPFRFLSSANTRRAILAARWSFDSKICRAVSTHLVRAADEHNQRNTELKIETQRNDDCTLTLTVEVEDERVQPALRAAARDISKRYPFPGFRPGKAPYETVLRQVGEGALYEAALEKLGQKVYEEALDQEKIEAFAPGSLDDVQLKPMVLKFTVPLKPEVELGDYRAVRVEYTPPVVSEEELSDTLERLRERQAVLEPVERPAALQDVVVLDVKGYLREGENPSDFLLADKDVALLLDEKADWPMVGFAPRVAGMKAGDEKKFDLSFPEDYANESLRGQAAHFEVACKEVKSRSLPEWSDELAKEIGAYESLDDLRAKVRAELAAQSEQASGRDYTREVVDRLVAQSSVTYPPVLLEQELDDMLEDLDRRLREQRLTLEDYLKIEKKTREELREENKPRAEDRLKRALVLSKIVELEGLKVNDADIDDRITALSAPFGEHAERLRQTFSSAAARRMLGSELLTNKALERVTALAKGESVPPPAAIAPAENIEAAPAETAAS